MASPLDNASFVYTSGCPLDLLLSRFSACNNNERAASGFGTWEARYRDKYAITNATRVSVTLTSRRYATILPLSRVPVRIQSYCLTTQLDIHVVQFSCRSGLFTDGSQRTTVDHNQSFLPKNSIRVKMYCTTGQWTAGNALPYCNWEKWKIRPMESRMTTAHLFRTDADQWKTWQADSTFDAVVKVWPYRKSRGSDWCTFMLRLHVGQFARVNKTRTVRRSSDGLSEKFNVFSFSDGPSNNQPDSPSVQAELGLYPTDSANKYAKETVNQIADFEDACF